MIIRHLKLNNEDIPENLKQHSKVIQYALDIAMEYLEYEISEIQKKKQESLFHIVLLLLIAFLTDTV